MFSLPDALTESPSVLVSAGMLMEGEVLDSSGEVAEDLFMMLICLNVGDLSLLKADC